MVLSKFLSNLKLNLFVDCNKEGIAACLLYFKTLNSNIIVSISCGQLKHYPNVQ